MTEITETQGLYNYIIMHHTGLLSDLADLTPR